MRVSAVVLALSLGWTPLAWAGDLPKEKERALREIVARLVAEPEPGARWTLAAAGASAVGDAPLADVVAAVRKGPIYLAGLPKARKVGGKTEDLTKIGNVVVGYSFEHEGAVFRYAVDVPKDYDAQKPAALLLDPGHGSGKGSRDPEKAGFLEMWRRFSDESGHGDWLVARTEIIEQVGQGGARGKLPEDETARVFDAFFRDLFSRFHVDPDRVYVTGVSQTGYWAWFLGCFRADRFAGIAPMSASSWPVDRFAGNVVGLPVYVLHGDADTTCEVAAPRRTCALLQRLGADVRYKEISGAGHDYSVWKNLPEGLGWLGGKARAHYPKRISKSVRNSSGPWCSWVRIDRVAAEGKGDAEGAPAAGIDGELEGQTVRLYTDGVTALTVFLSSEMLDLARPVKVLWNGNTVHDGGVQPNVATLLETVGERCDWSETFEAALPLKR